MYKVGEIREFTYTNPPVPKSGQHEIGAIIDIFLNEKLIAKYEVLETDDTIIKGKIINTYNHGRRKVKSHPK